MSGGQIMPGTRHKHFGADPNSVIVIGIDTVHKEGEHALWDPRIHEEIDRPFVENVKKLGILQPITCRKEDDDVVVVFGRKRTMALRIANEELVKEGKTPHELPVLCEKGIDDADAFEQMIAENEGRRQTSLMQKSARLKDWFNQHPDASDDDAAVVFVTTATTIRNWKKGWKLDPKVAKEVQRGGISFNSAVDLADLPPEEQVEKLREYKKVAGDGKKISTAHTEVDRKKRKGSVAATAYAPPKMAAVRKLAEDPESMAKLPETVVLVLKYLSGLSDGSDIPELKAMVETTPARGKLKTGPKLSAPQQAILDAIDAAEEHRVLMSDHKKKPAEGLIKLGLIDRFEGDDDGLLYLRRHGDETVSTAAPATTTPAATTKKSKTNGKGHSPTPTPAEPEAEGEVAIPDVEELETMRPKEFNALCKALEINMKLSPTERVKEVLKVKKSRETRARRAAERAAEAAAAASETVAEA